MLLISLFAASLMIFIVSSFALKLTAHREAYPIVEVFSETVSRDLVQPNVRALTPFNHEVKNMPQVHIPSMQHETLHLLERLEVQPNYYNSRKIKGKSSLPLWHVGRMSGNSFERHPIDRSSFNSQIPRPPRLTRKLSENRRRFIEAPPEEPRPFNFPLEGLQPSEFKKTKSSKKENITSKSKKVNNIQDILSQEQIPNVNHYRMPVGIHISGSFKNLKKSGISNVFRRYVQVQPQMSPSQFNYQRIAFDPFYPYKPKSLSEINSLAMKQLGISRNKKKYKNNLAPGLIFQQSGQRPVSTSYFLDPARMNNSLQGFGGTRNLKNEPFSLKLEVYPIRSGKKVPVLPVAGAPFFTTIRPNTQSFEPFIPQIGIPYGVPVGNSASYFNYMHNPQQYKGKFASSPSVYSNTFQRDKFPMDSSGMATHSENTNKAVDKKSKPNSNQLLVHLNVFPSKKENTVPQNHLYDVIQADVHERIADGIGMAKNETSKTAYVDCEADEKVFDDEVASTEVYNISHQDKQAASENLPVWENVGHREFTANENQRQVKNGSEIQIAKLSTFRFPVENLMKFQANDAVI